MKISVNGKEQTIKTSGNPVSLSRVVNDLGHNPRLVVVELNGTIVSPNKWEQCLIKENDSLEIVTIVGEGS